MDRIINGIYGILIVFGLLLCGSDHPEMTKFIISKIAGICLIAGIFFLNKDKLEF